MLLNIESVSSAFTSHLTTVIVPSPLLWRLCYGALCYGALCYGLLNGQRHFAVFAGISEKYLGLPRPWWSGDPWLISHPAGKP